MFSERTGIGGVAELRPAAGSADKEGPPLGGVAGNEGPPPEGAAGKDGG